jgi:hypothetical protein
MFPPAVVTNNPGPIALNHQGSTFVAEVTLSEGSWLIFAKVDIANFDGDPQNATAQLLVVTQDPPVEIDRNEAHAQKAAFSGVNPRYQSLCCMIWWTVGTPLAVFTDTVQLNCWSHNSQVFNASLTAVQVALPAGTAQPQTPLQR